MKRVKLGIVGCLAATILSTALPGRVLGPELSKEEAMVLVEEHLVSFREAASADDRLCILEYIFQFRRFVREESVPDFLPALEDSSTGVRMLATLLLIEFDTPAADLKSALEDNILSEDPALVLASLIGILGTRPVVFANTEHLRPPDRLISYLLLRVQKAIDNHDELVLSQDVWDEFLSVYVMYPVELVETTVEFLSSYASPPADRVLRLAADNATPGGGASRRAEIALRAVHRVNSSIASDLARAAASGGTPQRALALHALRIMRATESKVVENAFLQGIKSGLPMIQKAALDGAGALGLIAASPLLEDLISSNAPAWREAAIALAEIDRARLEKLAARLRVEEPDRSRELRKVLLASRL